VNLQGVDGFGELAHAPGAAAELAEDRSGLELGVRPLAGGAEARRRGGAEARRRGVSRAPCSPLTCLTQRQGDAAETATKFACRLQFGLQYLSV
jgi:hypothetical protein